MDAALRALLSAEAADVVKSGTTPQTFAKVSQEAILRSPKQARN